MSPHFEPTISLWLELKQPLHKDCLRLNSLLGQKGAVNPTEGNAGPSVRLKPYLGERGADNRTIDYLGILADPEYMAAVKERLNMIAQYQI